jgi:hypothetical protein
MIGEDLRRRSRNPVSWLYRYCRLAREPRIEVVLAVLALLAAADRAGGEALGQGVGNDRRIARDSNARLRTGLPGGDQDCEQEGQEPEHRFFDGKRACNEETHPCDAPGFRMQGSGPVVTWPLLVMCATAFREESDLMGILGEGQRGGKRRGPAAAHSADRDRGVSLCYDRRIQQPAAFDPSNGFRYGCIRFEARCHLRCTRCLRERVPHQMINRENLANFSNRKWLITARRQLGRAVAVASPNSAPTSR